MNTAKALIYIVDDDPAVGKALSRLLSSADYTAKPLLSAHAFLDAYDPQRPGCLLLDVNMPELDGFDLQKQLTSHNIHLPIIFITGHGDIPMSVQAMKQGAVNFFTKPIDDTALLQAVQEALQLEAAQRQEQAYLADLQKRFEDLTARECDVFHGVVSGLMNKQIALQLGITERTVKAHRAQIMQKMQADSLAELVRISESLKTGSSE